MKSLISKRLITTLAVSATLAASAFALAGGSTALAKDAELRHRADDISQPIAGAETELRNGADDQPGVDDRGGATELRNGADDQPGVDDRGGATELRNGADDQAGVDDRGGATEPRHGADDRSKG